MKRTLTIIAVLICIATLCTSVHATSYSSDKVLEQIRLHISEEDIEFLEITPFDGNNSYDTFEGKPIIKRYNRIYWDCSHLSVNEIIDYAKSDYIPAYYIVFDSLYTVLRVNETGNISVSQTDYENSAPTYVEDIRNQTVNATFCGTQCSVEKIVCFEDFSITGAAVYYITDKGNFVKFYDTKDSDAVEFSESDYRKIAYSYMLYLIDHATDENGNVQNVYGQPRFMYFLENIYDPNSEVILPSTPPEIDIQIPLETTPEEQPKTGCAAFSFALPAFSALLSAPIIIFIRKRKL